MSLAESYFPLNHNNPPEPTPFDLSKAEIEGLYMEAKNWLDGEGVTTEAQAEAVSKLIDLLRKAEKAADDRRIAENKPFDDGKAEVQARYAPLIANTKAVKGMTVLAIETAKAAIAPFLLAKQAKIDAAAKAAREKADEEAAAAVEAIRAARQGEPDLEAKEQAEALLRQAEQAEIDARHAEKAKAHATGGTRAIGLRTVWRAEMTDANAFAKWVWTNRNEELVEFLAALAEREVKAHHVSMPGVTAIEDKAL